MRLINRFLAALLALAVIVVSGLVVIEVVTHWFSSKPAIVHWHDSYAWLKRTSWTEGSLRVVLIAIAVVGLLLLFAELRPAKVSRLEADPAQTDTAGIDTAYTRRSVAATVRAAVNEVDGVRATSVSVARRSVRARATTAAPDKATAQSFSAPITTAAQSRLDSLQLRSSPSLAVRVDPRSN